MKKWINEKMRKWKNEKKKNRLDEKNDGIEKCKSREGRKVRSEYSELKSWSNKYEEISKKLIVRIVWFIYTP